MPETKKIEEGELVWWKLNDDHQMIVVEYPLETTSGPDNRRAKCKFIDDDGNVKEDIFYLCELEF